MKSIPLSKGYVAIVDDDDFETLNAFKWSASETRGSVYAIRVAKVNGKLKRIYMHRQIMGDPPGKLIDHRDRCGLHNWRTNLRVSSKSGNQHNRGATPGGTSKFKGVSWHVAGGKWQVHVQARGKRFYLGLFDSEKEAALAADAKIREIHGQFARLNFPLPHEQGVFQ